MNKSPQVVPSSSMISLAKISMYTRGSGSVESRIMSDLLGRAGTARDRIEREQRGGRSGGRRGLERTGAVKNCARVGLYLDGCALYHLRGGRSAKVRRSQWAIALFGTL